MNNWVTMLIIGVLSLIAGLMAMFNPFGASLVATAIAGWSFAILGVLQIFDGVRAEGWGGKLWAILLGVIALFLGINILGEPLQGMVALTVVVGFMFAVSGIFKVIVGFAVPSSPLKWAVLVSGAVSLVLGFMVLSNIPGSAVVALGVLLAVELLSNGVSMIALALSRKDEA